jgi:acetyl-CoA carboxylase biotin carboxyl carrier protein
MTVEEIRELIHVVNESGIAELEVQRGEDRVRIRRSTTPSPPEIVLTPAAAPALVATPQVSAAPPASGAAGPAPAQAAVPAAPEQETELVFVKSPIVGTYYDAPSPGAPPFVNVGDFVRPGQILCIIESMKLMNEIEAEIAGVIVKKLVDNGRPVEYGEALYGVQPA